MGAGDTMDQRIWRAGLLAFGLILAVRVVGLVLSPVELHGDEAQYWTWSQHLDWGYYSKPPMIAWTIALTTALFGDGEWAVRLAAPFLHTATTLFIALLGRDLFGARIGILAGALYATMPGVVLSSGLISTDALLLTFWSGGLFALNRLRTTRALPWGLAVGAAFGLGFLSKYAMIYFLAGVMLAAVLDRDTRNAVLSPAGGAAALVGAVLISPNLLWNAAHDFSTVAHTADNANWSASLFNIEKLGEFWGDQFAVFGPITLIFLIAAIVSVWTRPGEARRPLLFLVAFVLPPLVIVTGQAFISRAHGNWAAAAYAAAPVLLAGWAFARHGALVGRRLLIGVFAFAMMFNVFGGAVFSLGAMSLDLADRLCLPGGRDCVGEGFKRARGWKDLAGQVTIRAQTCSTPYSAIVMDNRLVFHDLEYYTRDQDLPLRMWLRQHPVANSHAEQRAPLTPEDGTRVLVVSMRPHEHDNLAADFSSWTSLGTYDVDRGAAGPLTIYFFEGRGFAPLERGPDYEARFGQ